MSDKTKKIKTTAEAVAEISQQIGILLMTTAATIGMLELPDHQGAKIIVPNQPIMARVTENEDINNPLRREREESAPHYINYSVTQRTPSRSGKH